MLAERPFVAGARDPFPFFRAREVLAYLLDEIAHFPIVIYNFFFVFIIPLDIISAA